VALVKTVRRPTWQDGVAFGGYAVMFLPWFAIGRSQFLFYMLPAVPFMALGVAATLRRLPGRSAMISGIVFATATLVIATAFMPAWTGGWVSRSWIDALGWLPDWPL
jgi:dolichyl-phosphate-mannose--protein O-mannosyl transferase